MQVRWGRHLSWFRLHFELPCKISYTLPNCSFLEGNVRFRFATLDTRNKVKFCFSYGETLPASEGLIFWTIKLLYRFLGMQGISWGCALCVRWVSFVFRSAMVPPQQRNPEGWREPQSTVPRSRRHPTSHAPWQLLLRWGHSNVSWWYFNPQSKMAEIL